MTRFNSEDHNNALRACWDANAFGAKIDDGDLVTLNRAASAYACNEPETLSRAAFGAALNRVNGQIESAKLENPQRVEAVIAEREAKRLAAMTKEQAAHLEKAKAAKTQSARREHYFYAAAALPHQEYQRIGGLVRPVWEKIPAHIRPKLQMAIGSAIGADHSFNKLAVGAEYKVSAAYDGSLTVIVNGAMHSLDRFVTKPVNFDSRLTIPALGE